MIGPEWSPICSDIDENHFAAVAVSNARVESKAITRWISVYIDDTNKQQTEQRASERHRLVANRSERKAVRIDEHDHSRQAYFYESLNMTGDEV
jgi:hypothetical protein